MTLENKSAKSREFFAGLQANSGDDSQPASVHNSNGNVDSGGRREIVGEPDTVLAIFNGLEDTGL